MELEFRITFEAARVNSHLLQREAAEMIGISLKTLQNFEKGVRKAKWDAVTKRRDV